MVTEKIVIALRLWQQHTDHWS